MKSVHGWGAIGRHAPRYHKNMFISDQRRLWDTASIPVRPKRLTEAEEPRQ